jgi:hypothetical protein
MFTSSPPSSSSSRSRSVSPSFDRSKTSRKKGKSKESRNKSRNRQLDSISSTSSNNSPPESLNLPIVHPVSIAYQADSSYNVDSLAMAEFFSSPPQATKSSLSPFSSSSSGPSNSSSSSRSLVLPPPSTFPPLSSDLDSFGVQLWLSENGFEKEIRDKLRDFTSADLFALSKSDMKALIGVAAGIRLSNRIKIVQEQMESQRQNNSKQRQTNSSSSRHSNVRSPPKPGRYGQCSHSFCSQPASFQCDNEVCCTSLCQLHAQKQLITGFLLCSRCASETLEGRMLSYVGIADQQAAQANKHYYISESAHAASECAIQ